MSAIRYRPLWFAGAGLICVWLLAWGGYTFSQSRKVTAQKVADYLRNTDLQKLSRDERARALRQLARQMNALPIDERRRARLAGAWDRWFQEMTEMEKAEFIDATLPSGFKQMLQSFQQLPEEKRRRAVQETIRELQRARAGIEREEPELISRSGQTNRPPELSEELQQRVVTLGLKSIYSESSAQTKAELAPMLEEMQRLMESGRLFRPGRR
ncbi:MAG: hypothetical protein L0Y58_07275 [Verrucomicrobia subdivision 3 bacterium]|nr:hypothetical protein [Limisphaerales bacterium]